jgi:hypothetical protein
VELSSARNLKEEEGEPFIGYSVMCYVTQDAEYKLTPSGKTKNKFENMILIYREYAYDLEGEVQPLVTGTTTVILNGKGGRTWGESELVLDDGGVLVEPAFLFTKPLPYEGVLYGDSAGLEDLEVHYSLDGADGSDLPYLPIDILPEDFPEDPCVAYKPIYCGIGHPANDLEDPDFCHAFIFEGRIVWTD